MRLAELRLELVLRAFEHGKDAADIVEDIAGPTEEEIEAAEDEAPDEAPASGPEPWWRTAFRRNWPDEKPRGRRPWRFRR